MRELVAFQVLSATSPISWPQTMPEGNPVRSCLLTKSHDSILHIFETDVGIHYSGCGRRFVAELHLDVPQVPRLFQ